MDEHGQTIKTTLPVQIAYARCNTMMEDIVQTVGTDDYRIFLTDSDGNFRKTVSPEYKANRKKEDRPILLPDLEEFLIRSWGAIRAVGCEADDYMGTFQMTNRELGIDSVICTIDKDLNTIPGKHYNFVKCKWNDVSEDDATFFFYKQMMMGDSTDGVAGCPGIGLKKAEKALLPYHGNESELYQVVYEQYKESYPQLAPEELEDLIIMVGRLVYIRHEPEEMWLPPSF